MFLLSNIPVWIVHVINSESTVSLTAFLKFIKQKLDYPNYYLLDMEWEVLLLFLLERVIFGKLRPHTITNFLN